MSPKGIITKWVEAFNSADADLIADFYSKDAINHQVANEPIIGKENIKQMFSDEFSNAKMVCIVENIFEDGNNAILEWKDPIGFRGCGFFEIKENKIINQRGYWDKLTFMRLHNLPIPTS